MGAKETREAIEELENGKGKRAKTLEELFDDLKKLVGDIEVDLDEPLPDDED